MLNRKQDREQIEKELAGLPKEKCMALAARSALLILPMLAVEKKRGSKPVPFVFWSPEDRSGFLSGLFSSYAYSLLALISEGPIKKHFMDTKYNSHHAASIADSNAANFANIARTHHDPFFWERAIRSSLAARVAHAANFICMAVPVNLPNQLIDIVYSVFANTCSLGVFSHSKNEYSDEYIAEYNYDFDAIRLQIKLELNSLAISSVNAQEFAQKPLWTIETPPHWQQLWKAFKQDTLSLNAGFEVWLDWYEDRLQGKPIDFGLLARWLTIPEEIKAQGVKATNAYWANFAYKVDMQPLNRVRAIFIGYGEAGKTSLIAAIRGEFVAEGGCDMTPGIEIREWPVEGNNIKAHLWDFGGQVMAHATHQFFLRERCLYVVVLNARSEINSTEQAEYWLEHVKAFGKNARVMLVGNKCDQAAVHLDMGYLTEKYPNIVDFYPLSCTQAQIGHKAKFEQFKQDFCRELAKVDTHQVHFTKPQSAVLEELRHYSPTAAFLKHQDFETICAKHGVGTEGTQNRKWLLDILDKLGVVIHFPQLPCLEDYVLNPRWLTYGVYTLIYTQQARLTESDVVQILSREKVTDNTGNVLDYPKDKCRFIMDAMQQFKLCYPLTHVCNTLIIPALLPSDFDRTKIPFQKLEALAFEFTFRGFLPRHIMPELIVNRHEEIYREIVWQNGVLLKSKNEDAWALIEVDFHLRVLSIWVQGKGKREYLSILRDEVLQILDRLELVYEERVELPLSACENPERVIRTLEKVDYRQILNTIRNGSYTFYGKHNVYDLKKVLDVIVSESELKNIYNVNVNKINVVGRDMKNEEYKVHAGENAQVQQFVQSNGNTATQTTSPEAKEGSVFKNPLFYLGLAGFIYFMAVLWGAYDLQMHNSLGNKTFKEIVLAPLQLFKTDEKK